jgi:hypothetical protein
MKATLVNLSRWRTDHLIGVYKASLAQLDAPNEPEFLTVTDGYSSACVEGERDGLFMDITLSHHKTGEGSAREGTALAALATGRTLDEGSFGQLAKYILTLLAPADERNDGKRPSRTVPKWARDLPFTQRDAREEPLKIVSKIKKRTYPLGISRVLNHNNTRFISEDDVAALLKYTRRRSAHEHQRRVARALEECREARTGLHKTRTADRRYQRYLDKLERIEEARRARA